MLSRILLAIADYFIKLAVGRTLNKALPIILKNVDLKLPVLPVITGATVKEVIVGEITEQIGQNPTVAQYEAVIKEFDIEKAATNIALAGLNKLF